MDEWYKIVGNLKDDSEVPYSTQQITHDIFRELRRAKIKDKGKFKNRMGPEFEAWAYHLTERYPEHMIKEILNDDEFWEETLKITQRI
jgi:hypothetical protein